MAYSTTSWIVSEIKSGYTEGDPLVEVERVSDFVGEIVWLCAEVEEEKMAEVLQHVVEVVAFYWF
jgi:hypothetical protein